MSDDTVNGSITLRQLLEQHPEWADLPLVVCGDSGLYDYVGCSGLVYASPDYSENPSGDMVLVFAPN